MSSNEPADDDRSLVERVSEQGIHGLLPEEVREAVDSVLEGGLDLPEDTRIGIAAPAGGLGAFSRVGSQAMAGSGLVQRLGSVATSAGRLAWPTTRTGKVASSLAGGLGGAITAGHLYGDMSTDRSRGAAGLGEGEASTGIGETVSGHRDEERQQAPAPTDPLADPQVAQNEQVSQARFEQSIERDTAEALSLREQIDQQSEPEGEVLVDFDLLGPRREHLEGRDPDRTGITRQESGPVTEAPEQAAGRILNADEKTLRQHQKKLYAAGFYNVPFEEIRWGFAGPETQSAALKFMQWAAGFEEDGEKVMWHRALDKIADESGGFEEPADPEEPRQPVSLSDPSSVGQMADQLYRNIAGRRATDEEKRAAVAMIHRLQREQHQQLWDARVNEMSGAEVEQVDPQARIAEQVEETAPEDVMDVDVRSAAQGFRGTIGGR